MKFLFSALFFATLAPLAALAQNRTPHLSFQGMAGHIEMPSAFAMPDGTLAFALSTHAQGVRRSSFAFQITERLSGSFRYAYFDGYFDNSSRALSLYDRSFDLRYLLVREDLQGWLPAVTVGLQDFGGTGVFGGEYLVASRHLGETLEISAGLGWGRLGSYKGFDNPLGFLHDGFKTRPGNTGGISDTGKVDFDKFFRGDAALFFGVNWQPRENLGFSLEYSSDAMEREVARQDYAHRTPINIGVNYRLSDKTRLDLAYLSGSTLALGLSTTFNARQSVLPSGREPAPPPVVVQDTKAAASWNLPEAREAASAQLAQALEAQGITLESIDVAGPSAEVSIKNTRWLDPAQAYGRTVRVLSAHLPQSVETFEIRSEKNGIAVAAIAIDRTDLAALEYAPDAAWQTYARADLRDAGALPDPRANRAMDLDLALRPYALPAFFDPDNPLRIDVGAELFAEWRPTRQIYLSGALRQPLLGNLGETKRRSNSVLEHVRSDFALYTQSDKAFVEHLTLEHFSRPAEGLYGRVGMGYFERMFAGVSAELLWAPIDRPYALGVEVNGLRQRDYEGLGFLDYSVFSGHVSGYYDFGAGYGGQLDVGRYLAGDLGATLTLSRSFGNGIEVGAFATLTDVSFEDFGEGSFDKGFYVRLPLSWLSGEPTQRRVGTTIRPIQRDGGAKVDIRSRLHPLIKDERAAAKGDGWGRFWR